MSQSKKIDMERIHTHPHLANIGIDTLTLNHHPPKTSDDVMNSGHWVSRTRRESSVKNIHFDKRKFQICSPLFFPLNLTPPNKDQDNHEWVCELIATQKHQF
jgi:hypothetical protein